MLNNKMSNGPENVFDVAKNESDRKSQEIGGIPLPKEQTEKIVPRHKFRIFGHRGGFGEKTLSGYTQGKEGDPTGPMKFENTLTALETAVQAGADTLEIDFGKTPDGEIVTTHLMPFQKLNEQANDYLKKNPEAMTMAESFDWLAHQDEDVRLYTEIKSNDISLDDLEKNVDTAARKIVEEKMQAAAFVGDTDEEVDRIKSSLRERLLVYAASNDTIKQYLQDKKAKGIPTDEYKLFWLTNGTVDTAMIDSLDKINAELGDDNCKLYGVEQGMMPYGTNIPGLGIDSQEKPWLRNLLSKLPKVNLKVDFKKIGEVVDYAHSKGLQFVTGTVNEPGWIRTLVDQGVDGVVPDNPVDFEMAGITRPKIAGTELELATDANGRKYVPESMRARLNLAEEQQIEEVKSQLEDIQQ